MARRFGIVIGVVLLVAGSYALGAYLGHRAAIFAEHARAQVMLQQSADRLNAQVNRHRYLPAVMARHPDIVAAAQGRQVAGIDPLLGRVADTAGLLDVYLMDRGGITIAASNWTEPDSFVGKDFSWRPYFRDALGGALAVHHAVGTTSGVRGYFLAHPVRDEARRIIGVLAMKIALERLEDAWRADPNTVFFEDARGVIFLANRPELVLRVLDPEGPRPAARAGEAMAYAGLDLTPLPMRPEGMRYGLSTWTSAGLADVPEDALWLSTPMPALGITAHLLRRTEGAAVQAQLWGALSAAGMGAALLLLGIVLLRRRALRQRLALEAQANAWLEAQVRARTAELSSTNAALRAEVSERTAAEAALRRVQDQLVQAGKLRALGEMSAGISHELNQPLTAIQTLADNGVLLLAQDRAGEVEENLSRISALAARAGRIIRNLRAFARKEDEKITDVDLVAVVDDALDILAARLRAAGVTPDWQRPDRPVPVRGGRVRLQQVVVNLVSNALDAMAETEAPPRLSVQIDSAAPGPVRLLVRDSGPGIVDPDRIFDPFFTTKPVGEGTGLGLSISYGIVQSFGGALTGRNLPEGGAVFELQLSPAGQAGTVAA